MRIFGAITLAASLVLAGCSGESATSSSVDAAATTDGAGDAAGTGDAGPADSQPDAAPPIDFCQGPTAFLYDPVQAPMLAFPDDYHTVADTESATGLRVHFDITGAWFRSGPPILQTTYTDLQQLDGWGTTAGVVLRFSAPVTDLPHGATSVLSDAVQFLDLGADPPVRVPFEVQTSDEGTSLILWPMRPLRPRTRHAVVVTTQLKAADGGCIAPAPALQALLAGQADAPGVDRLGPRYAELLARTGIAPGEVSAATAFTTQTTVDTSVAVAEDIAGHQYAWSQPAKCKTEKLFRVCNGAFQLHDYRQGRTVADGKPVKTHEMPVRVWLPLQGKGPFPVVIFGHGLGSDRGQAQALADLAAPAGVATVAIDAVQHGEHPAGAGKSTLQRLFGFFAISAATQSVDALALRDNWRQSTYDKLQLVRLLVQQPDIDGDGQTDLAADKLAYLGVSLGGIMGPELLALSPDLGLGILSVPGGRVASIIADGTDFGPLVYALKPDTVTDGDVDRYFPALQTLLDAGDSANYAPHVLKDRLPGAGKPQHLLFDMVIGDTIVPNSANRALARALGIPHVAPVLQDVGLVPLAPPAPFTGNLPGGLTAGLFQFDRVTKLSGGAPIVAEHGNMPKSKEGLTQALHFVQTWLATGKPEIVDPYAVLGTPGLPGP